MPLNKFFNKVICNFVGYYNGNIQKFSQDHEGNILLSKVTDTFVPKILIVSREYYSEKVQSYPVDNARELNKLLKLEHLVTNAKFHSWGSIDGQSQVNLWKFNENIPYAFIKVPESLLFALSLQNGQTAESKQSLNRSNSTVTVQTEQELYVSQYQGGIYSSLQSGMINTVNRFVASAGLPLNSENTLISKDKLVAALAKGISKLPLNLWQVFIQPSNATLDKSSLVKKIALPFFLTISLYLIATSGYLVIKHNNLVTELSLQSKEIDQALALQQNFDDNLARYNAIKDFTDKQQLISPIWLVLTKIIPQAEISTVQLDETGAYIVKGTSEQATTTLEQIAQQKNVIGAKFDTPSRKSRGRDRFSIRFSLQDHTLNLYMSDEGKETIPASTDNEEGM